MDTIDAPATRDPAVALPGICARVYLPRQVNFLRTLQGGHLPVGTLSKADATMMALAQARAFLAHYERRAKEENRLSRSEREHVGGPACLVHPGLVERIARAQDLTDMPWHVADPIDRARACDQVRATLTLFLEELHRD